MINMCSFTLTEFVVILLHSIRKLIQAPNIDLQFTYSRGQMVVHIIPVDNLLDEREFTLPE